jgi:hypothetical protein
MGHYDDCYEATRRSDELRRKEDLLRWISDKTLKMESWELEVVYDVVQNTSDYSGMFNLFKRASAKEIF